MKTHTRAFLKLLKRHLTRFGWVWLAFMLSVSVLTHFYKPALNRTQSLPYSFFIIEKNNRDVKAGDFAAFIPKRRSTGGFELTFVKEIACTAGHSLSFEDGVFYCDGRPVARPKERSLKGEKLEPLKARVIEEDEFFVRGTHPDSYDSRYEAFGLIPRCALIGKARPVF